MTDTPQVLLAHHLKTMKLADLPARVRQIARQCASEGVDHVRLPVETSPARADRRAPHGRAAHQGGALPRGHEPRQLRLQGHPLAQQGAWSWSWPAASTSSAARTDSSRSATVGPARPRHRPRFGLAACQKGLSVRLHHRRRAMVHELIEARDDKQLLRFQKKLATFKLLIVDELGFSAAVEDRRRAVVRGVQPTLRAGLDAWSPPICPSTNGPRCSAPSASPARSSIASPTTSTSSR